MHVDHAQTHHLELLSRTGILSPNTDFVAPALSTLAEWHLDAEVLATYLHRLLGHEAFGEIQVTRRRHGVGVGRVQIRRGQRLGRVDATDTNSAEGYRALYVAGDGHQVARARCLGQRAVVSVVVDELLRQAGDANT